nr:Tn3 family transposase [Herbidospora mongoliensis]
MDAMAAAIRTEVNTGFFQTVAGRLDAAARARLARLMVVDPVTRRSEFDRLKDVAKAASLSKFKQRLALLADIEAIGPTGVWLEGVPPGKVGHFAGEAHVTDVADMRKVGTDKRLTLLASFVHTAATGVRDDVVTMFCKRIAAIHKKGREHLEAHRAESERLPEQSGGVDALASAHEAVSAHHGNNYLPLLDQHYRSHRPALFTMAEAIELEAVEFLRELRGAKAAFVPEEITVERPGPAGEPVEVRLRSTWTRSPLGSGARSFGTRTVPGCWCAATWRCACSPTWRPSCARGDIAVAGSDSYANLHDQLMSWEECRPLVPAFCAQGGHPGHRVGADRALPRQARGGRRRVPGQHRPATGGRTAGAAPPQGRRTAALGAGAGGRDPRPATAAGAAGHPHPHRLPAEMAPPFWARVRLGPQDPRRDGPVRADRVCARHPAGPDPGRRAHARPGQRARAVIGGNKHTNATKVDKASVDVINAFSKLDVASVWGDGKTVAADGSQIDTWENNLLAETSIRYGGYGAIAYRHVSNTYVALFSRFIPCGVWEAIYIIDGLLKNTSEIQPDTIHADTPRPGAAGLRPRRAAGLRPFAAHPQLARLGVLPPGRQHPATPTSTRCSATRRSTGA